MDGSDSPGSRPQPSVETPSAQERSPEQGEDEQPGIWSRWFRKAGKALVSPEEDSESAVGLGPAFESLSTAERTMVNNVLRLRDLRVQDVMIPRADVVAVAEDASLDTVIAMFEQGSFSRMPVYRETLDDPIGFVHLKDIALSQWTDPQANATSFRLSDHVHSALFVPPSMRIVALLQRMQGSRVHMALVIDEFGGVDGLVTIEDLVEQIVGDIDDEHDEEDQAEWAVESAGVYTINARADIREFEEQTGVRLLGDDWAEEVDTLGGLVFTIANRVPARGEVICHPLGHEFQVTDADARRIKKLRLTLNGIPNTSSSVAMRQAAE